MPSVLWPLQLEIVTALRADQPLTGLVSGVYDTVPPDVPRPYVTIGAITENEADAHNQQGRDALAPVHVWSDYAGAKEAADILSALEDVLDRKPLAVAGWTNVSIALESAASVPDPDPDIRHINATFRVWLTKEA